MASRATFRPGTMPSNTERIITEAATAFITEDNMREVFGCGPDASKHLAVAQQFADAGYDHLALINAGPGGVLRLFPVGAGRSDLSPNPVHMRTRARTVAGPVAGWRGGR